MARYIDIEAVGIGKAKREQFLVPEYADGWNNAIEIFENEPTADVEEVRHGRWIKNQYISQVLKIPVKKEFVFTCSLCGHDSLGKSKYCRECGAKMDGGKEDV